MVFDKLSAELGNFLQHLMHGTNSSSSTHENEEHDDELIESVNQTWVDFIKIYV
jgi:hypothetical protein